jgi:hypothetical protein
LLPLAHIGRQRLHDRPVLPLAFACDPLQAVNAAEADFELVAAELLDRLGEALRNPPFSVRFGLLLVTAPRRSCLPQGGESDN